MLWMFRPPTHVFVVLVALLSGLSLAGEAGAQVIEEEELPDLALGASAAARTTSSDDELTLRFAEAQDLFHWQDPAAAASLFDALVDGLELRLDAGEELSPRVRALLVRSFGYRARVRYHLAGTVGEDAEADLVRMLELDPGSELGGEVRPELARAYARLHARLVGLLELRLDPPDPRLLIDGRPVAVDAVASAGDSSDLGGRSDLGDRAPGSGPSDTMIDGPLRFPVLAGTHRLEAIRAGYTPLDEEIEVTAGSTTSVRVELERHSAVLRLITRPTGCEVVVDGRVVGTTLGEAPEGLLPLGAVRAYAREEFSDELLVGGIAPGLRLLEVRKPGFRPYRSELLIDGLLDYPLPPIVLEEQRSMLVFRGLPNDAEVRVNGKIARLEGASGAPRLRVDPGEHQVQVTHGAARMFQTRVRLADRQTVEVNVRLRPSLAMLGVLGNNPDAAARFDDALRLALGDSEKWTLLDRSAAAQPVLSEAGVDVRSLRALAAAPVDGPDGDIDWRGIQVSLDRRAPGLVYLLAVLDDDLLPEAVDIWIWPAAPGPALPDRVRVTLDDRRALDALAGLFHQRLPRRRAWLGGQLVGSDGAFHPVVADLSPGGPLEQAGVRVGEEISSIAGVAVRTPVDVAQRLAAAETGETLEIRVVAPGMERNTFLRLGSSPWILEPPAVADGAAERLAAVAFTDLVLLEEQVPAEELWTLRLGQALLLVRDRQWEEAVRRLGSIEAPRVPHGVGQAAVDYWLGRALTGAGSDYSSQAREAFRRSLQAPGGRLEHNDGPWIAPRAKARLDALGGSP